MRSDSLRLHPSKLRPHQRTLPALLILYGAASHLACWTASLFSSLDSPIVVLAFLIGYFLMIWRVCGVSLRKSSLLLQSIRKASRRPLQMLFWFAFVLLCVSALQHPLPTNYDHLTYRFPRVLHWHAEGGWHWVDLADGRLNYSGIGFEWMWAPIFVVFKSDFGAVLLNLIAFACLPSLTYQTLRGLKVSGKIARLWMWVLPFGFCFLLQAGGAGNDLIGSVFVLASFSFLLRAKQSQDFSLFALGVISAALATGIKLSNAPLLLPLGLLALSGISLAVHHWKRMVVVLNVAVTVSFLPIFAINLVKTGDFSGDPLNSGKMKIQNPVAGIVGNTLQIAAGAVMLPVNPFVSLWNTKSVEFLPVVLRQFLAREYPRFSLRMREIAGEEDGGLGIGFTTFLLFSYFAIRRSPRHKRLLVPTTCEAWALIAVWISFGVFMAKFGSESSPRIAGPFYPLLLAGILVWMRGTNWRNPRVTSFLAGLCMVLGFIAVILTPSRPLWPWQAFAQILPLGNPLSIRFNNVYETYARRADAFQPLKQSIRDWSSLREIGVFGLNDDPETSLWRPFDGRRVRYISRASPALEELQKHDVVIAPKEAMDEFLSEIPAGKYPPIQRIDTALILKARVGPRDWSAVWSTEIRKK